MREAESGTRMGRWELRMATDLPLNFYFPNGQDKAMGWLCEGRKTPGNFEETVGGNGSLALQVCSHVIRANESSNLSLSPPGAAAAGGDGTLTFPLHVALKQINSLQTKPATCPPFFLYVLSFYVVFWEKVFYVAQGDLELPILLSGPT